MILMDTDVCIELLRGNKRVLECRAKAADDVAVCFMTMGELFYGVERSSRPAHNRQLVERFLLSVPCLHSDSEIMERFGALKANLAKSGSVLPDADILVAATALTRCDSLVSGNTTHFSRIPGLSVLDWTR